jgi:hypothetical protein
MTTGFERYGKKTRRAAFLEEMEQVVPWSALCLLVEPHYPKACFWQLGLAHFGSLIWPTPWNVEG